MGVTLIHTSDWQLGKPFAGIGEEEKRALVRNERFEAVTRIGALVRSEKADFLLVAGDLFDSPSATKDTVAAACSAIGVLGVPVYAIPGNHDHGGPGSIWGQDFFRRQREQLAPNLQVLTTPEPVELENAVLFPCPLLRRHEADDPTAWLRSLTEEALAGYGSKPRLVLAHGSVLNFAQPSDDEEAAAGAVNFLQIERLPAALFDYLALGDWHGTKQIDDKAWYSGTPEPDRFAKGEQNDPGNVLVVKAGRGVAPDVRPERTGRIGWHEFAYRFADDSSVGHFVEQLAGIVGARSRQDLLRLSLEGPLGMAASAKLEQQLESLGARLLRLKLENRTTVAPSPEELDRLTRRSDAPLVSRVVARLAVLAAAGDEEAQIAGIALRELYAACAAR